MAKLTAADDSLHAPATPGPDWTETCWFSFDQPGQNLSVTIYAFFRPNLGICSLAVYAWDASGHSPWDVRYGRSSWHLPMPESDLTDLTLGGLHLLRREPLMAYRLAYEDGERIAFELEYQGLRPPHEALVGQDGGHFDQPCAVTGWLRLDGERIAIDCLGMRDRTWSPRPDSRSNFGAAYTFGNASADEQFLVVTSLRGNSGRATGGLFSGYLVRDGIEGAIVSAERRVTGREAGYPLAITLKAEDEHGRKLEATGTCLTRLANQALPGLFAWMSTTEWEAGNMKYIGQDQECWSSDMLGPRLMALGGHT